MASALRIEAALTGNLPQYMQHEADRGAKAVTDGTSRTLDWLKAELRGQIVAAFGSQRLANTWQGRMYPAPPKTSLGAAGVVWSNAPNIIAAFQQATVIRSEKGFWLAVPSPDCPKEYAYHRVTPSNWNEAKYGKLRFVYRAGKASLLVVDNVKKTASGRVSGRLQMKKSGGYKQGAATVIMFYLVPQVSLRQRIDPQGAYAEALDQLLDNVIGAWNASDPQ
jgi:hypothetical protein